MEDEDLTNDEDKTKTKSDYLATIVSDDDGTVDCDSHPDDCCIGRRTECAAAVAFAVHEPFATSEAKTALEVAHS